MIIITTTIVVLILSYMMNASNSFLIFIVWQDHPFPYGWNIKHESYMFTKNDEISLVMFVTVQLSYFDWFMLWTVKPIPKISYIIVKFDNVIIGCRHPLPVVAWWFHLESVEWGANSRSKFHQRYLLGSPKMGVAQELVENYHGKSVYQWMTGGTPLT